MAANEELEASNEAFEKINNELMTAQENLKESEQRYRTLFESANEGILLIVDGKIILCNPKILEITGASEEELKEKSFIELVYDEDKKFIAENYQKRIRGEEFIRSYECRLITKGNGLVWININVTPVEVENKTGSLAFVTDITERIRTSEIMIQTEKMITVGGLAAGMAHEINNPLGIIMQGIQNTRRRISPDLNKNVEVAEKFGINLENLMGYFNERGIEKYLNGMEEAGNRAAIIISNMLNFSRRSNSQFSMIDIHKLLDDTIELAENDYDLKGKYDFKHINIYRNYTDKMPKVPCVVTEIEQVILNLLKNSAHAISEREHDELKPEIKIKTESNNESAIITILDNGIGMKEETKKRIFEPFFTTKSVGTGTGLGLSVSYYIITNNHKGSITVDSKPGVGTEFTIMLPLDNIATDGQ